MKILVTGAAGFVGSHWVDNALSRGHHVIGIDNLSSGFKHHLTHAFQHESFEFVELDILNLSDLSGVMQGIDEVYHFAANADIRNGLNHPQKDLQQNTIGTMNVLEAVRQNQVERLAFASTGAIYGDAIQHPTPENTAMPIQTSLYGASKLAAEGLIQAYCEGYGMQAAIFRFVSLVGPRYSHGHIFDFCQQLINKAKRLKILGDGNQRKSYLHVSDCMAGIELAMAHLNQKVAIYNLGHDETCIVTESANWICQTLNLTPQFEMTGGKRGWVGDSPLIHLDCHKIKSLGFSPQYSIEQGVKHTVEYLLSNQWLFEQRA